MRFDNLEVLVVGMARSGVAAAELLADLGARVTVNDAKPESDLGGDVQRLREKGITVVAGGHPVELIHDDLAFVVKNPAIPYDAPIIAHASQAGVRIITEIELAYQVTQAPIISITGSNGKTTTTTLTGHMLREDGQDPIVAGNIGLALCRAIKDWVPGQWIVAELSSFQLMGIEAFRPRIAAVLNIYPGVHLDYHGTFDAYAAAKWRIFENQTSSDVALLNADQPDLWDRRKDLKAAVAGFSRLRELDAGVFVHGDQIIARWQHDEWVIGTVRDIALPGAHNLENALAASALSVIAGAKASSVQHALRTFHGIPHRLEPVRTLNGVDYVNDSKATNGQAAAIALKAYDRPIVWIAGGKDRGVEFDELVPIVEKHVKAVVALGEAAHRIQSVATRAGVPHVTTVGNMEEAVQVAHQAATAGDVVLLSPACASWDMFERFEQRGDMFKEAVHRL